MLLFTTGRRGKFDFYKGNRFTHKEDKATRLLYDCDGHIAGIQATVTNDQLSRTALLTTAQLNSPAPRSRAGLELNTYQYLGFDQD